MPWFYLKLSFLEENILSDSTDKCNVIAEKEFSVTKNNLVTTLPVLHKEFEVKLELNVLSVSNTWVNVFHMTTGGDHAVYGDRIPALWLNGGSNPYLHACASIDGSVNYCKNYNVPTNTWHKVKLSQRKSKNGNYVFEFEVNNMMINSVLNSQPADFNNVKVFASDPWYPPFHGSVRNFQVCFKG